MSATDTILCAKGLKALAAALGLVEAERFIMLMKQGAADYTEWRRENLYKDESLESFLSRAKITGAAIRQSRHPQTVA